MQSPSASQPRRARPAPARRPASRSRQASACASASRACPPRSSVITFGERAVDGRRCVACSARSRCGRPRRGAATLEHAAGRGVVARRRATRLGEPVPRGGQRRRRGVAPPSPSRHARSASPLCGAGGRLRCCGRRRGHDRCRSPHRRGPSAARRRGPAATLRSRRRPRLSCFGAALRAPSRGARPAGGPELARWRVLFLAHSSCSRVDRHRLRLAAPRPRSGAPCRSRWMQRDPARADRQDVGQRAALDAEARVVLLGLQHQQRRERAEHAVLGRQLDRLRLQRLGQIAIGRACRARSSSRAMRAFTQARSSSGRSTRRQRARRASAARRRPSRANGLPAGRSA